MKQAVNVLFRARSAAHATSLLNGDPTLSPSAQVSPSNTPWTMTPSEVVDWQALLLLHANNVTFAAHTLKFFATSAAGISTPAAVFVGTADPLNPRNSLYVSVIL